MIDSGLHVFVCRAPHRKLWKIFLQYTATTQEKLQGCSAVSTDNGMITTNICGRITEAGRLLMQHNQSKIDNIGQHK